MPRTAAENSRLQSALDRIERANCIRLFTNGVCGGDFCDSGMAAPSIILTRQGAATGEPEVEIVLTKLRGTNGVPEPQWSPEALAADIFYASVKDVEDGHETLTPGLVLKIIDSESTFGSAKLIRDFPVEAENYAYARQLQGTVLPRFPGLFTSASVHCLVFEDAGRRLRSAEYKMDSVKQEALQALDTLMAAGVSPYPTERLLCRGHDGLLKFSTLWHATTPEHFTPEYMARPQCRGKSVEELQESDFQNTRELLEALFWR